VFGRRLHLPDIRAQQVGRRQGAERAAINAPMQGTAADLDQEGDDRRARWLDEGRMRSSLLILQVHDELVLEVPEDELDAVRRELPKLMAGVAQLSVPLVAEVGVGAQLGRGPLTCRGTRRTERQKKSVSAIRRFRAGCAR
jgi:DNA polymerase-1